MNTERFGDSMGLFDVYYQTLRVLSGHKLFKQTLKELVHLICRPVKVYRVTSVKEIRESKHGLLKYCVVLEKARVVDAAETSETYEGARKELPEKRLFGLSGATIWPKYSVCLDRNGHLVSDSCFDEARQNKLINSRLLRRYPVVRVNGHFASLSCGWYGYYHFWVDDLPKLFLLPHIPDVGAVTIFVSSPLTSEQELLIKFLSPAHVHFRKISPLTRIRGGVFHSLPALSSSNAGVIPPSILSQMSKKARQFCASSGCCRKNFDSKKIYISRSKAARRRLQNETDLILMLQDHGFVVFHLEELSISEQISLFSQVTHIVGPSGAGLTNMIFSTDVKILEIHTGKRVDHYHWLATMLGHQYFSMVCAPGGSKDDDGLVDIDLVHEWLFRFSRGAG